MHTNSFYSSRAHQAVATLLPSPPFYFAICETPKDRQVLHKSELPLIAGAGIKRQQEFCSGRFCAHQVLDRMGYQDIPLLADQYGAPVWPCGITGSISHSGGIAVAAAVQKKNFHALGIDIQEHLNPFPYDTLSNLFSAAERNAIWLTRSALRDHYAYSIFSAKESVLKCCYYAFDCVLELNSINITMKMNENIFFASILDHSINQSFLEKCRPTGHIRCDPTHVYTAIWV